MTDSFDWTSLLNKAKSASFDPIPTANYHISVHEAEAVTSSTGKPMIKLKLNVEDGAHANRKLIHQLVLSVDNEVALAIFFNQLKCFGIGPEFLAKCPPGSLAPIAQAMLGKHAIAKVGQKEWQNEQRNEVKGYLPMSAGAAAGAVSTALPGLPDAGSLSGIAPGAGLASVTALPGLPTVTPAPTYSTPENGTQSLPGLPAEEDETNKAIKSEGMSLTQGEDPF